MLGRMNQISQVTQVSPISHTSSITRPAPVDVHRPAQGRTRERASGHEAGSEKTPRLLTEVWRRGDGDHQVGLDVEGGVRLRVADDIAAALRLLDGRHTLEEVAALEAVDPVALRETVTSIPKHLWAADGDAAPAVRLIGAGHLGRTFAEQWTAARPTVPLVLIDPMPPPPGLYEQRHPSAAACLQAALAEGGVPDHGLDVSTRQHWWDTPGRPTITVIAQDAAECDRALTGSLVRDDQPHLLIRPLPTGAVVGPLVEPGTTSCLRCADLIRAGDAGWGSVLAQAVRRRVVPSHHHLAWAASVAVFHLGRWMDHGACALQGATWESTEISGEHVTRLWPHHPDCGCGGL